MNLSGNNLSKKYKKNVVFSDLSVEFTNGITALLGPNGVGKTTLINMMATILPYEKGTIYWNDTNIMENEKKYRGVLGYVPQNPPSYMSFTAYQFLEYISLLKEIPYEMISTEIDRVLEIVRLSKNINDKIKSFSGGMRQRLAIAQAFLGDPDILIFDEPTVGLDPKERVLFKNHIRSLASEKVIILSTHIVSDIEEIADHIIMLKNGKIFLSGAEEEIINQYKESNPSIQSIDDIFMEIYD